jgi:hypothetical protein
LRGYTQQPNWDRVYYGRCAKAAKLLLLLDAAPEKVNSYLSAFQKQMDGKALSWTLETAVKHYAEYLTKQKPKQTKEDREKWEKILAQLNEY